MPNDFKARVYFWIFGPIYKRIFEECDTGMKQLDIKQKRFQERWGTRTSLNERTPNSAPRDTAKRS